jgi:lysyl-tRNA synthetase class 2
MDADAGSGQSIESLLVAVPVPCHSCIIALPVGSVESPEAQTGTEGLLKGAILTDVANPEGGAESAARSVDALSAERRSKRDYVRDQGIDPYPSRFDRSHTTAELRERYGELPADAHTGEVVQVAGRITSVRGHGKLVFVTLQDVSGPIQLLVPVSNLSKDGAVVLDKSDLGDWVGATGEVIVSRRGELSVELTDLQLLSKALRPLPDKWHGLSEAEMRYRQREVDLLANEDTRRVFGIRFKAVAAMRTELMAEDYLEVETPILQPQAGGAIARPFYTHANALDIDLSLRIAPELYLKRLVIGGFERVFEIARNFRNEGVDTRHSPEFTALEAYRAFGDFNDGMDLTERLVVAAAQAATGRMNFTTAGGPVDLTPPWPRQDLLTLIEEAAGRRLHPSDPVDDVRGAARQLGVEYDEGWGSGKIIFEIYDKVLLPSLLGPVFVCGFPVEVSPLARHQLTDDTLTDRFELVVDAKEYANGYSELNIPEEQDLRFRGEAAAAAKGDLEAHPADMAFVRALEYGLPPTSGIGIGVDRLVMLLAEVDAIRDVILFPMLRPESTG